MTKRIIVLVLTGLLFLVSSCASLKEPPMMIYPDPHEDPGVYPPF
jgi:hypothetical protein